MDAPTPTRKPRKKATTVLTDTVVKTAKPKEKEWKLSDSGGLHLLIKPSGKKFWRFSYRFAGMQKTIGMGTYPEVTLAEAREKHKEARQKLKDGIDPSVDRKLTKLAQQVAAANTFDALGAELMEKAEIEGKAPRTVERNRWLLSLCSPFIGNRPISELSVLELMQPLNHLKTQGKLETAGRVRVIMGMVFRYAVQTGRASIDPTYTLRGALPQPKVKHRPAIVDEQRFGVMVRRIWNYHGEPTTTALLKLLTLFFCRPGELRNATWDEFDLVGLKWTIPIEHDKMRRGQPKPITRMAAAILTDLKALTGRHSLVFPQSKNPKNLLSENTPDDALKRIGIADEEHCAHGFRSSASTMLNASGLFRPDVVEREVGHKDKDEIRAIYNRATYWQERVAMCEWWAEKIVFMLEPRIRTEPWPEAI